MLDLSFPDCCGIGVGPYIPGMCPVCDVDDECLDCEGDCEADDNCCGIGGRYISGGCPSCDRDHVG